MQQQHILPDLVSIHSVGEPSNTSFVLSLCFYAPRARGRTHRARILPNVRVIVVITIINAMQVAEQLEEPSQPVSETVHESEASDHERLSSSQSMCWRAAQVMGTRCEKPTLPTQVWIALCVPVHPPTSPRPSSLSLGKKTHHACAHSCSIDVLPRPVGRWRKTTSASERAIPRGTLVPFSTDLSYVCQCTHRDWCTHTECFRGWSHSGSSLGSRELAQACVLFACWKKNSWRDKWQEMTSLVPIV